MMFALELFTCPVLQSGSYSVFNPTTFLCAPSTVWFPIVILGVLLMLSVLGIIYGLSPILGRTDIRTWARAKMFDGAVTIIFALIFLSFSTVLFVSQPASIYNSLGLLPKSCNPNSASFGSTIPIPGTLDFYGIAACEIFSYNQNVMSFSQMIFYMGLIMGLSPSFSTFPFATVGVQVAGVPLIPIQIVHQYLVPLMGVYFTLAPQLSKFGWQQ